nr:transcriptional regulator [Paenibacillus caui]
MAIIVVCVAPLLLAQSIFLFTDARKKGAYAWFWGIWGLLHVPTPTIFYFLFVVLPYRKKRKKR